MGEEPMRKILALAAICLCLGWSTASAADIKIGLMAPLTGSWATEGREMKQVLELLAEEVNARGGLLGGKVELFSEDDAGDPQTAALAAQRLAARGIVAVIGTYGSSITEASQNIYNESGIIQIANGSTAVRLSEKGLKFFFRTCPRDDEQGRVGAETIKKLKVKKVAILHDNTTYAKGLAEEAKGLLNGMKIVFYEALTPGERDYTAILGKLKSARPDVVFFTGYYPEAGLLLRQKKEMKWNVPFIGGDATNNPDLVKIAGADAAKGFCFLSAPLPRDLPTKQARSFLAAFEKKYGHAPSSIYSVLAGDGFQTVVAAVRETKSTDAARIADFLHRSYKEPNALTGGITFNAKGDRVGEVYRVYKVDKKGNFILQP
jgi:branched-chain amino acid transport system substrate-binding protein